jgi:hypothetical protein
MTNIHEIELYLNQEFDSIIIDLKLDKAQVYTCTCVDNGQAAINSHLKPFLPGPTTPLVHTVHCICNCNEGSCTKPHVYTNLAKGQLCNKSGRYYSSSDLRLLRAKPCMLPDEVCTRIKKLKIKRRFRGSRGRKRVKRHRVWDTNSGVHFHNLRSLRKDDFVYSNERFTNIALVNVCSICNKVEDFLHHVVTENIDVCIVCETWLKEKNKNVIAKLKQGQFNFLHTMRTDRRGGGIGLLYNRCYKARILENKEFRSFESIVVALELGSLCVYTVGIYRPPYSPSHPVTFTVFIEEF